MPQKNGTAHTYSYGDSDWKDLLTSYVGQSITYDAIGNPLNYLGSTLTWQNGRQLATYSNAADNLSISYSYDVNGLRTEKAVTQNGVTTNYEYLYDCSTLLQERIGTSKILNFLYTADGTPYALEYSTDGGSSYTIYYYLTNLQGDIISILNSSGTAVVTYSYDSWGDITSTTGTLAATLGADNPLRYRGYCYDDETELYYVTSRYYNPEVGRFINADGQLNLSTGLNGLNLFLYCNNNPINMVDPNGQIPFFLITAAVGAIVGAVIGGVIASKNGRNVWAGIGIGATVGGLIGLGAGAVASSMLAGSVAATTAEVAVGGAELVSTVGAGGLGAGATFIKSNLANAISATESGCTAIQSYYPPNDGFCDIPQTTTLDAGTLLQRTGSLYGRYVAPYNTPSQMLSLPYDKIGAPTTTLQVMRPIEVVEGRVAPWFGQIGGGIQYILNTSIKDLIDQGVIKIFEG